MISSSLQIYGHAPITAGAIVFMIDFVDLILNVLFMGIAIRLPVYPIVIVFV
jgi:hypothetical protein